VQGKLFLIFCWPALGSFQQLKKIWKINGISRLRSPGPAVKTRARAEAQTAFDSTVVWFKVPSVQFYTDLPSESTLALERKAQARFECVEE
jgi:hypothetical protein